MKVARRGVAVRPVEPPAPKAELRGQGLPTQRLQRAVKAQVRVASQAAKQAPPLPNPALSPVVLLAARASHQANLAVPPAPKAKRLAVPTRPLRLAVKAALLMALRVTKEALPLEAHNLATHLEKEVRMLLAKKAPPEALQAAAAKAAAQLAVPLDLKAERGRAPPTRQVPRAVKQVPQVLVGPSREPAPPRTARVAPSPADPSPGVLLAGKATLPVALNPAVPPEVMVRPPEVLNPLAPKQVVRPPKAAHPLVATRPSLPRGVALNPAALLATREAPLPALLNLVVPAALKVTFPALLPAAQTRLNPVPALKVVLRQVAPLVARAVPAADLNPVALLAVLREPMAVLPAPAAIQLSLLPAARAPLAVRPADRPSLPAALRKAAGPLLAAHNPAVPVQLQAQPQAPHRVLRPAHPLVAAPKANLALKAPVMPAAKPVERPAAIRPHRLVKVPAAQQVLVAPAVKVLALVVLAARRGPLVGRPAVTRPHRLAKVPAAQQVLVAPAVKVPALVPLGLAAKARQVVTRVAAMELVRAARILLVAHRPQVEETRRLRALSPPANLLAPSPTVNPRLRPDLALSLAWTRTARPQSLASSARFLEQKQAAQNHQCHRQIMALGLAQPRSPALLAAAPALARPQSLRREKAPARPVLREALNQALRQAPVKVVQQVPAAAALRAQAEVVQVAPASLNNLLKGRAPLPRPPLLAALQRAANRRISAATPLRRMTVVSNRRRLPIRPRIARLLRLLRLTLLQGIPRLMVGSSKRLRAVEICHVFPPTTMPRARAVNVPSSAPTIAAMLVSTHATSSLSW